MKNCIAMACPNCRHDRSVVKDKRNSFGGITRRRRCLKCGHRFTTEERIVFPVKGRPSTV